MRRPSLLAIALVAASLPVLALAAPVTTQVPVPGPFDRVAARGEFEVQVREGSPASISIEAEPGWADRIQVEVAGSELRLSRKREYDTAKGVVVKVVTPEFRGLTVSGSGKGWAESGPAPRDVRLGVSGSGELSWKGAAKALDLSVSGSGSMKVAGASTGLDASISGSGELAYEGETGPASVSVSGSGDASLAGKGASLKVAVSGSGGVDAKGFAARDATVSIAGSGDVDVQLAGGTLTAQIAGSGNVTWSGEGKLGAVATAGSGRVRQR